MGCPHHDLAARAAASTAFAGASGAADHTTTAPPGSHTHQAPDHPDHQEVGPTSDDPDPHPGACYCLGDCNGTTVTEPPSADPVELIGGEAGLVVVVPETGAEFAAPTPYLLPFATAPPLAL